MTETRRTVAAERDMSRIHEWLDTAVARSVNDAAKWLNTARYWLDLKEAEITEWLKNHNPECECEFGETWLEAIAAFRALLPAVPETTNRRAETGEEVISDARDASDAAAAAARPGLVSPGGSETGGGYRSP